MVCQRKTLKNSGVLYIVEKVFKGRLRKRWVLIQVDDYLYQLFVFEFM